MRLLAASRPRVASAGQSGRRKAWRPTVRTAWVTFLAFILVTLFLLPMVRSFTISVKTPAQISEPGAPIWPAVAEQFEYKGKKYDVLQVPIDGTVRSLALVKPVRDVPGVFNEFIDPLAPDAGIIKWQGNWRTLEKHWIFSPTYSNYSDVWDLINFPRGLFNTVMIAGLGTIGTVLSSILVAFGFARFRFPGRAALFTLLISTIFLPTLVTFIPTYIFFQNIGWLDTWLPLIVPTFFANAFDVFLMRQFFLTIPHDLDEAAAIDGAGPLRILWSVVLPQAWAGVAAVAIFHFVYSWNDFFEPLVYLINVPDLQPLAVLLRSFNGIHFRNPAYIQAATLMTLAIPVLIFVFTQRLFMRGVVITGVEK